MLVTEFGADSVLGHRSGGLKLWSEDYQAALLAAMFETFTEFDELAGTFPYLYEDHPDPSKKSRRYWDGMNLKGVVTHGRTRKVAFHTLRRIYLGRT